MNKALFDYCLYLADSTLILGHRNSEWCGHGPILEQDIALTNISLDLIGQARNFYQYAALLKGNGATEDTLAYLRDVTSYRNCLLVELPNGHWGQTILRQFLFSTYQYYLFQQLVGSADGQLAAIAEKSLKEITYHVRWSSEWVIRLGGAMPKAFNFSLPVSLIQSVVQAGDNTCLMLISVNPCCKSVILMFMLIASIAGQPLYVGVITISTDCSPVTYTARTMPRSITLSTGISGSNTCPSNDHIFSSVTMLHPDAFQEEETVQCPHCGSYHTRLVSRFGSTACKALYQCNDCKEPFDYFKCH